MDLDGDGNLDVISGSYSREDKDMAGLFQVLWGNQNGTWKKAAVLNGSNRQPLILSRASTPFRLLAAAVGKDDVTDRICTRPFAVDLNGDGNLDIVAGNFTGTFGMFAGEGKGKFAPKVTWLEVNGTSLAVDGHSDPFFVDWDQDGDFDLVSGSAQGGVFLFVNTGSKTKPKFAERTTLLAQPAHGNGDDVPRFGDAHLKGPAEDTRVWVDDVDGDGKLDLLVGDDVTLLHVQPGFDEAEARTKYAAWQKKRQKLFETPQGDDEQAQKKWHAEYQALEKERETFAREDMTGFVWLLRQKGAVTSRQ